MLQRISKSQDNVLSYYRNYIAHNGKSPTYEEASEKLDINPSAIYKHIQNLIDMGYIQKDASGKLFIPENFDKIPILGEIACGEPLTVYEKVEKMIDIPKSMMKGPGPFYALKAKGSSMEDVQIFEGDILIIRQQDDVSDGDIGVIIESDDGDEKATLKTVFHTKAGILGKPKNKRFSNIVIDRKKALIRGKLAGIISQF
ncbi:MAG TPA: transcriptional repressor LexA [Candidatus Absconditabacterales bacterium]|nr:transcriptional repressor LexA [Candidatus Absconditabacterales bacterium]